MLELMKWFDTITYDIIHSLQSIPLSVFMLIITTYASAAFLIPITIASIFIFKKSNIGKYIFMNLGLSFLLNMALKLIVHRERPTLNQIITEEGFSFLSAHAMISMAFYGFIVYLVGQYIDNKKVKVVLSIFLSILILLIGISRIYLGVHYATDVLAGFIFGLIYLWCYIKLMRCLERRKQI